ncbi:MAG: hypothetical protein E5V74_17145 [Mesorhizobium sp.]|nr:MAG: hypothetical protein E5V74_17145 [Mesorhizobium sp.]
MSGVAVPMWNLSTAVDQRRKLKARSRFAFMRCPVFANGKGESSQLNQISYPRLAGAAGNPSLGMAGAAVTADGNDRGRLACPIWPIAPARKRTVAL